MNRRTDEVGISQSIKLISRLIDEEVDLLQSIHPDDDIDASRIVLIGYSQGGAMSLLAGLSHEERLAGLAVLSGRLPMQDKFKNVREFAQVACDFLSLILVASCSCSCF